MKRSSYTYCVVKYVHDPAAGEMLNIGVLLYAPEFTFVAAQVELRYERLSDAFADFDGEHYKRSLKQFEEAITQFRDEMQNGLLPMYELPIDAAAFGRLVWPDQELSFQLGPMLAGVTDNPQQTLEIIFDRMVNSQYQRKTQERRTDEQVWGDYQKVLAREQIVPVLRPKTFVAEGFELKYDHTYQNDLCHILQPVSLDYARVEGMKNKISRLLGESTALQGNAELGKVYLLLGRPRQEAQLPDYHKAKKLLDRMPVTHELVEETQAEEFARKLASEMRAHGVIDKES
jgi:hypothetical protein